MYIQANKINKNFSGTPLFEEVSLQIHPHEKIGLVGQNGTGKTTLFHILLGNEGIDAGTISRQKGLRIGWVPQNLVTNETAVVDYIAESFEELQRMQQQMRNYEEKMAQPDVDLERVMTLYGTLQQQFEEHGGYQLADRIQSTLKGVGLEEKSQASLSALSGGERVRVELAKILVQESDVLLLDEPTNHLDLAGIKWLENYLRATKQAFVVISHDRAFLDEVTNRIIEIEDGQLIDYPGNYSRYIELKKARLAELSKNYELQQKEIQRMKQMIRRYRQWGNEGDNEAFFKKAKEIERRLEKIQLVKPPVTPKKRLSELEQASRSGKEIIVAKNIGKIISDKLLFTDSSFAIYRGERVAIVGENGSGKSTLVKLLLGEQTLDEGTLKLGSSLRIGYLPQQLTFEQPTQRVLAYALSLIGEEQKARQTLAHYGFYKEDVAKRLQDLSGGEQVRLYLMKLFQEKINLLILDEPTNHLDIYVREEIEELLENYTGTLLAVTHDRYFLQKNFNQQLLIAEEQITKQPLEI
ncbi:ABC-F type ribosomal protection protein [Enterococcus saccharolyticus]|uniref:ribosomal protection-like ABC-F family protein n=1 Tax=Enterococcus saccharolyticus TaxID=41997 RepID=UPI001E386212|nr:ABC-F type ribosomal protection protein [Enterococcus saccharolyticus]MCD5002977.1 ABC-F type ribosomal protection protein [Enterococcus saccharolyticus]